MATEEGSGDSDGFGKTVAWARGKAGSGAKKGKRGIVFFITSDKTIQSVMTGAAFGIISKSVETGSAVGQVALRDFGGLYVPRPTLSTIGLTGVFYVAFWADRNTEEFRSLIEEKTGEEAADDDVADEEAG